MLMKRISFLVVAMFISVAAFSQTEVAIGIKAGPNFANINTNASASANYDNRTGFHGGGFVLFKMTKIGIQPELLFSQQGTTIKVNSQDFDANYSYINIPIILKLYTVAGINLQVGPQFGFLASQKNELLDELQKTDPTIKDQVKNSDMSLAMGVGWDLPFGLSIDGRYNLGLSDLSDGSEEVKNQVWQLSVGLKLFNFGK
jgi:Outer membrane protein beta-barrel domain